MLQDFAANLMSIWKFWIVLQVAVDVKVDSVKIVSAAACINKPATNFKTNLIPARISKLPSTNN